MPNPFDSKRVKRSHLVYTEAGHEHRNEDAVMAETHLDDNSFLICILADGQGGQAGGAAASRTAVDKCLELASAYSAKRLLDPATWYEIISGADEAVSNDPEAGFTTLIGLCAGNGEICGASCGDSAALLVSQDDFEILTEKQRKNPPVGSSGAYPVAFSGKLKADRKLLVMSDGVWRCVAFEGIAEVARQYDGQDLLVELRKLQVEQSGGKLHDDFSVIVIQ